MAKAIIIDDNKLKLKSINDSNFAIAKIIYEKPYVAINSILPFRIKFTTIGIESSNNFPGIGLQIIGVNNYIM